MELATAFENIHWLSVIVAAVSAFLVGGIWYGPLFGKAWMEALGITEEALKERSVSRTFGISMLLSLIATLILEMFIGPAANLVAGAGVGLLAGAGWVATFLGILYLFEMRSMKIYFLNAGYCTVALTVAGGILGAWS